MVRHERGRSKTRSASLIIEARPKVTRIHTDSMNDVMHNRSGRGLDMIWQEPSCGRLWRHEPLPFENASNRSRTCAQSLRYFPRLPVRYSRVSEVRVRPVDVEMVCLPPTVTKNMAMYAQQLGRLRSKAASFSTKKRLKLNLPQYAWC